MSTDTHADGLEDDDRQTIEYDALTEYDRDQFEATDETATLSDMGTAYRVRCFATLTLSTDGRGRAVCCPGPEQSGG